MCAATPDAAGLAKPLVWTESDCLGAPMFTAAGYVIDDEGEQYPDGRFHLTFGADVSYSAHVDTLDFAKAAAQADYEARIRAALSPETLARLALVERMAEALRALRDVQNGPPLVTYTDDWNRAMELADAILAELEKANG